MRNFREYEVWKNAIQLVNVIYEISALNPINEKYGITSQINRAAISIPSNIAEGASRSSEKDFKRFIEISLGSAFELETLLEISKNRKFIDQENYVNVLDKLESIQKQLNALRTTLINDI